MSKSGLKKIQNQNIVSCSKKCISVQNYFWKLLKSSSKKQNFLSDFQISLDEINFQIPQISRHVQNHYDTWYE